MTLSLTLRLIIKLLNNYFADSWIPSASSMQNSFGFNTISLTHAFLEIRNLQKGDL